MLERKTSERGERAAAAVLRQREEMLMLAQRAGGVGIFDWDVRDRVGARLRGVLPHLRAARARGHHDDAATGGAFLHPDDRTRMTAHLARAVEGEESAAADYRIQRAPMAPCGG